MWVGLRLVSNRNDGMANYLLLNTLLGSGGPHFGLLGLTRLWSFSSHLRQQGSSKNKCTGSREGR